MSKPLLAFVAGLTCLVFAGPVGAETPWRPSEPHLMDLLRGEGYGQVEQLDSGGIRFKGNGVSYVLFRYDDGDLQLYYGLTGVRLDAAQINEWNRTRRLSRAYLDSDGDPVLEADLLANAGLTPRVITEFVRVFMQIANEYRGYVVANDQSASPPPAARAPGKSL